MGSMKLRRDDQVEVIAGKDKGRVGKIFKVHSQDRVLVEKINMIKRHMKPDVKNKQGGILDKEAAIHVSNLKLICPKCAKTVRIAYKKLEDGTKFRICKKCGESVDLKA